LAAPSVLSRQSSLGCYSGPAIWRLRAIVAAVFDDAASQAEDFAIKLGKSALPDHTVKAIKIVEQLRAAGGWA
jgi:hypothetical protein